MTHLIPRLLVDCSTVVKWKLTSELHSPQAAELFLDWKQGSINVCIPDQLLSELVSALLGASRKHPPRLSAAEAMSALEELSALPFKIFRTTNKAILTRAFEIARQYNQRAYDCIYVALAEHKRIEFWTADERLYNALHASFPAFRWIAHYQRRRTRR